MRLRKIRVQSNGFVLLLVIAVCIILLMLGFTLHSFVGQQSSNVHLLAFSEVAHFLAEAGISASIRSVRDSLNNSGFLTGGENPMTELLVRPQPLPDTSLMSVLKDTWNSDLAEFSQEIDKTASIRVEVWLRDFSQTETDPSAWVDPVAKQGWLSIESTGKFRGMHRTLSVRRKVWVGNVLPPLLSKFTLHVKDANKGNEGGFNIVRNDYDGKLTDGPKPFVCLNHATSESVFEPKSVAEILSKESDPMVFQRRGWIYLGGSNVRLNITSGSGAFGEIFHFYDVTNQNTFKAIRFKTPSNKLPGIFQTPVELPWDKPGDNPEERRREVEYQLGHSFLLEGFHDKSTRMDQKAMYEGGILSSSEFNNYGAKSSILHLFGDARKGFQSRTKVFGNVKAAFPLFSCIDVVPLTMDVQQMFAAQNPPPTYFLHSLDRGSFSVSFHIKEFLNRQMGGPMLPLGILFQTHEMYKSYMSRIVEMPYNDSYNTMQDVYSGPVERQFPALKTILKEDKGEEIELKRDDSVIFRGSVLGNKVNQVVESRVQREFNSISDFWREAYSEMDQSLELNGIVRILNNSREDFCIPPHGKPYPLKVGGGGMIILEQGNLTLRGIELLSAQEALTIILINGTQVFFETPQVNHVNIVAPQAEIVYGSRVDLCGSVSIGSIQADSRTPGVFFLYREAIDPTRPGYFDFAKVYVAQKDSFWYEGP